MEVGGYPLAGLLVGFLGGAAALAFWIDAATYLVSAVLIAGIVIPPVVRTVGPRVGSAVGTFVSELHDGWRFLRTSAPLFQNTLISIVGQLSVGATIALTPFLVSQLLGPEAPTSAGPPVLSTIEAAIGVGNLIGGFMVGLIGVRMRKGRLVIGGFVLMGIATIAWGLAGSVVLAVGAAFAVGIFNLVWLVPSQTLFGELVPSELMGRVISMRSSLVFGAMTLSAAVSSVVAETVPVGVVIAVLGGVTVLAGLVGALLPAVRDA
jgi:MFS family permease